MKLFTKLAVGIGLVLASATGVEMGISGAAHAGVSHRSGTPLTSPAQKSPPPASSSEPPSGTVANTASQAFGLSLGYFFGHGGTLVVHKVSEIRYVETTVSTAMRIVRPNGNPSSYENTSPAWLIVANGAFQPGSIGCQCTPPTYKEMAMIVVKGQPGVVSGYSNSFNLSRLASLVSLPSSQWPQYQ
jgi:hypothetical protein